MVVATVALLFAALARWTFVGSGLARAAIWLSPIFIGMVHDWNTRRRVHPVYILGSVTLFLFALRLLVAGSEGWLRVGRPIIEVLRQAILAMGDDFAPHSGDSRAQDRSLLSTKLRFARFSFAAKSPDCSGKWRARPCLRLRLRRARWPASRSSPERSRGGGWRARGDSRKGGTPSLLGLPPRFVLG